MKSPINVISTVSGVKLAPRPICWSVNGDTAVASSRASLNTVLIAFGVKFVSRLVKMDTARLFVYRLAKCE